MRGLAWTLAWACAAVVACAALVLAARHALTPCVALTRVAGDPSPASLTHVGYAGSRKDHGTLFGAHRFDYALGTFLLSCTSTNDGHYWDYDHCTLSAPRCASEPVDLDREYAFFAHDVELVQATDGTYAIRAQHDRGRIYATFRTSLSGRRAGLGSLVSPSVALGIALGALVLSRWGRRRAADLEGWREGILGPNDVLLPEEGGAPLPLPAAAKAWLTGARLIYRAPPRIDGYRSMAAAPLSVREGALEVHRSRCQTLESRARALVVLSLVAGAWLTMLQLVAG